MALIGNISLLHRSPAKFTTGSAGFNDRANWNKPGMMRSRGDLNVTKQWKFDAVPSGMYAGRAFFAPKTAGRMVTRAPFAIHATASGALGLPASATASFAINADSVGGLIAGGVASCTFTVNGSAAIAGLAAGSASGGLAVNAAAVAGATAWGVASSTMTLTGTAIGYGRGYMQASTVDNTTLTPASITAAVWSAVAADFAASGTMGNKLNSAASGGVDYAALGSAVWASVSRTLTEGTAPDTAAIAAAVRDNLAAELAQLTKVSKLHGVGVPLVVTPTSRTAGDVSQTITTTGDSTTVSAA